MKKFLFVLVSLVIAINSYADDSQVYSLGIANMLSNQGYVKTAGKFDEDNNKVMIRLEGNWESLGGNEIHEFPKIALDCLLLQYKGYTIIDGWTKGATLSKQIRIERNLIEFIIPLGHDVMYIYEYIDNYPPKAKPAKSHKRSKRTSKRK